ncbi:MAG: phage late control D family protein, partial [Deltaproteobacteria bacterium]|nr:phage late control D family protein [Deltaproteobacteria bacterium]
MTDSEGTGDTVQAAADALAAVIGEAADVDFYLTIADVTGSLRVTATSLSERLGRMYRGAVVFQTAAGLTESDLLGRDVHLRIERQTEQRSLRGMIASATVQAMHGFEGRQRVSIEIVPAMHFMAHTVDSRIYQDVGVPDLVESLVRELVGSRGRKVKKDQLTASYPAHEYIVQHQESHLDFITRLCREEGIFFYFDHDADGEDHELLVLADSNANRPVVRESSDGRVPYSANQEHARLHEVVLHAERHEQIGATDAVVSGYDWTSPGSTVKNGRTDRGRWSGPKLEVHDHFRALRQHGYDGSRYGAHTAERQAQMRAESLDLARQRWTLETTVVTAKPGHVIVLEGAGALDDRYLI